MMEVAPLNKSLTSMLFTVNERSQGVAKTQCCQRRGLPAQLGYFEILCRGLKNCWAVGLKFSYFSFVYPRAALFSSNLSVSCQFREFLSLFNAKEHSFHQFQGLRRPKEQSISIIHFSQKSTI